MAIDFEAVLRYSRDLQRARAIDELLDAARVAVLGSTRYTSVSLGILERGEGEDHVRMLGAVGPAHKTIFANPPILPISPDDAMLVEIFSGKKPVVVVDARTDPRTNKEIVAQHQNRSIINIPLLLGEDVIGALAVGTYGDEPCIAPTEDELEMLTVFAVQFAPAVDRVWLLEREKQASAERAALRERLSRVERIETLALVTGGVAHDFNNLLTVILSSLHFLSEADLPGEAARDVRDATDAAQRARDLTRQLLAMGRKQPLRPEPLGWGPRLRDLLRLLKRLMPESVELVLEEAEGLPPVMADGAQIDQVVMNLCLNARDAMPRGGRLTLRARLGELSASPLHRQVRPGPAICLEVADTGHGIAPELVDRIFEPFFTTKGPGLGTGLGLAVAQGIVDQHGGTLECCSAPGRGTTFTVILPAAASARPVVVRPPVQNRLAVHKRVLAAEDDPAIRGLLERVLRDAGYAATVVADGRAAVESARAQPMDLVLLDAVLPNLSGREAFEQIRELQPHAGWVFMTGHAADTLPLEFLSRYGIELVEKPWLPAQLLAAMGRALDRASTVAA